MFGYSYEDLHGHASYPPYVYNRYPKYRVYRRSGYEQPPSWYPPGYVQMYGSGTNLESGNRGRSAGYHLHHNYPSDEFRSSSAHAHLPPADAEYSWQRAAAAAARRTQSSAHTQQPYYHRYQRATALDRHDSHLYPNVSSFANRFNNESSLPNENIHHGRQPRREESRYNKQHLRSSSSNHRHHQKHDEEVRQNPQRTNSRSKSSAPVLRRESSHTRHNQNHSKHNVPEKASRATRADSNRRQQQQSASANRNRRQRKGSLDSEDLVKQFVRQHSSSHAADQANGDHENGDGNESDTENVRQTLSDNKRQLLVKTHNQHNSETLAARLEHNLMNGSDNKRIFRTYVDDELVDNPMGVVRKVTPPKKRCSNASDENIGYKNFVDHTPGIHKELKERIYRTTSTTEIISPTRHNYNSGDIYSTSTNEPKSQQTPETKYRVISELLPAQTKQIHEVILKASGVANENRRLRRGSSNNSAAEIILDVESLQEDIASSRGSSRNGGSRPPSRRLSRNGNTSDGGSCTCYQCNSYGDLAGAAGGFTTSGGGGGHNKNSGGRRKTSKTSMIADENSNLVVNTGHINRLTKSTYSARRHLHRVATQARLLTQAELLKLQHFRRFLRASKTSQLDFLLRVEQARRSRDAEEGQEVDEEGKPFNKSRSRDESDEEYVALSAMLLCGDLEIRPDTFQAITSKPQVREKLYRLLSADTDVVVTSDQLIEQVATAHRTTTKSALAGDNLRWLEKVFKRTVGDQGEIKLNDFKEIVQSKNPFFVERVFQIFDKDDSGSISFQEFLDAIHQFAGQTPDDKIKFLFKVYDIDGDGLVQETELQHVMRACMDENGMSFDEDSIEELTRALYQDAAQGGGGITYSSLKSQISKHDGLLENLTISIDRWLVPPKPRKRQLFRQAMDHVFPGHQFFSSTYVRNNAPLLGFYLIFILVNISLIASRFKSYSYLRNIDGSRNWSLIIARAAGQCLNFCCTFVLLPMLRLSVTKLREKGLNYWLPLDKHVSFHALTGKLIGVYSLIHTIAHLVNLGTNILQDPVGFLFINKVPIPNHWSVNISFDPTLTSPAVLPPPLLQSPLNITVPSTTMAYTPELFNDVSFTVPESYTAATWLFSSTPGLFGLLPGLANPTGVALVLTLTIMIVCSMKWVRKSGNFEIFYWTHFLYLVFWTLTILHAPNFWKWFIGPFCLFAIEKSIRFYSSLSDKGKSYVTTGVVLPSKATNQFIARLLLKVFDVNVVKTMGFPLLSISHILAVVNLVIKRPPNFNFKPGDYIYLNIPSIAYFEWHPFTISSAPEQTDTISLHIRAVGHWTNSLYQYFEREQARLEGVASPERRNRIMYSLAASAKTKARKLSNSLTAGSSGSSPLTYNVNAPTGGLHRLGGGGVASSMNLWGGGTNFGGKPRNLTASGSVKRLQNTAGSVCNLHNNATGTGSTQYSAASSADRFKQLAGGGATSKFKLDRMNTAAGGSNTIQSGGSGGTGGPDDRTSETKRVARSFRYMRKKPTIIAYQPPKGPRDEENDLCSSNHFILDRIAEKDSTDNLFQASSEHEDHIDIKQANKPLHVYIDGPFGAPTSQIFHAQHAILIGTGIGVTPFASILQSIMHRYWAARNTCPKCSYSWTNDLTSSVMNLRKVDFFWINREQRSFEWFVSLLSQLEIEQAEQGGAMERFLDMHMYITSALQKTDMKAVGLQLALELLHEKSKRDYITGLKTRTIAGRPNWDKVFKKVSEEKKGKVTVFFCGPPQLGKILKLKCQQFGFEYRKENF